MKIKLVQAGLIFIVLSVVIFPVETLSQIDDSLREEKSFDSGFVGSILSVGGEVVSLGNTGVFSTRRFAKVSERLYIFDRMQLQDENSWLVLQMNDGWTVSVVGPGFVSFNKPNRETNGNRISVEFSKLLADPPGSGSSSEKESWVHFITPYGTIQNKNAKIFLREQQSYRRNEIVGKIRMELVVLPRFEEHIKPLVLAQTLDGDTWLSGQRSRVVLTKGEPPPAQESIRISDYDEEIRKIKLLFKNEG